MANDVEKSADTDAQLVYCLGKSLQSVEPVFDKGQHGPTLEALLSIAEESAYAPSPKNIGEFLALIAAHYEKSDEQPQDVVSDGLMVWKTNGRIVAFLMSKRSFEDAELHYIAVAKGWRNLRIASQLLSAFEEKMMNWGVNRILLEVGEKNISARHLYVSAGYEFVTKREKYYSNGEGCFVMEKNL